MKILNSLYVSTAQDSLPARSTSGKKHLPRGGLIMWLVCIGLFTVSATAQIQQAWVAHYNNGITNGTHQAVKIGLDTIGNIYVAGFSQNTNGNLGYVTIKYAPNGRQLWATCYDSANFPSATPSALVWITAIMSL
jgi:hypothetical protein